MEHTKKPGALFFAILFLAISLLLLAQIGSQTVWSAGRPLTAQPRFWPVIGLAMMVGFGLLHLWHRRRLEWQGSGGEIWAWLRGLEFAAWFLAYVFLVPLAGYLPASLLVAVTLTLRVGFRGKRWILLSVLMAVGIVVLFRAVLRVHVPSGQLYHALPEPISNFTLTWL